MEFFVQYEDESGFQWWDHADADCLEDLLNQKEQSELHEVTRVNYVDGSAAYVKGS